MTDDSQPRLEKARIGADEELFERLAAVERKRRRRVLTIGVVAVAVMIGVVALSFTFRNTIFQPKMDVEAGEREVLTQTNDPQCRAMIADVTAIGRDYSALEPTLDVLLDGEADEIAARDSDLEALKARVAAAKKDAVHAELRFDNTRTELNEWFDYVDNELTLLQRLGADRRAELEPDPEAEEAAPRSTLTPKERLNGATLATSEAFQKFRVWHTGGLHPCGAASEGEVGWQP